MADEPSVPFSAFLISLATSAAMHLGDVEDPASGKQEPPNLPAAVQMIEILAMLQDKTKGNLSEDEEQLLEQLLYELRMRYVEAQKSERRIIVP